MPPSKHRCFAAIFRRRFGVPLFLTWPQHGQPNVVPARYPGPTRRLQTAVGVSQLHWPVSPGLAPRWWLGCLLLDAMAGETWYWYPKASWKTNKKTRNINPNGFRWTSGKIQDSFWRDMYGGIFFAKEKMDSTWPFPYEMNRRYIQKIGHCTVQQNGSGGWDLAWRKQRIQNILWIWSSIHRPSTAQLCNRGSHCVTDGLCFRKPQSSDNHRLCHL